MSTGWDGDDSKAEETTDQWSAWLPAFIAALAAH
jgi:hypothetical protein